MYRISRIARSFRNASIPKRYASTEGAAPGIPPAAQPTRQPATSMSFLMPDTQPPPPPPEIQIPFAPDFWGSSSSEASPTHSEPELPKLSVVTDVGTKHSHNLFPDPSVVQEAPPPAPSVAQQGQGKGGILQDMSEDLGIPSLRAGLSKWLNKS
ncbi:hypothetical protein FB45DRAFT_913117 [Roridomyces roridus]|uniref:Uncharacterized protein n=1 Tax=Roridomyces roridus TaxID=1738132 RepID=A0AAD7BY02_9AGAR|nr:hypothetical protein FB45DRAFT_913117 [Roridomyces roridus]